MNNLGQFVNLLARRCSFTSGHCSINQTIKGDVLSSGLRSISISSSRACSSGLTNPPHPLGGERKSPLLGSEGLDRLKKKKTSPSAAVKVDFFYDTISPYSWFAFEVLQRYRTFWNLEITYKPVFMAGLSASVKNMYLESLTESPNKARYLFEDIQRAGKFFRVPLRVPESPFYLLGVVGSLRQQRFLTAVKFNHGDEMVIEVSKALWYRIWSEDMDCAKPTSLMVIGRRAGLTEEEVNKCLEDMETEAVKNELKTRTSEAVKEGAYGLPYIVLHHGKHQTDSFFGSDRFEMMADMLGVPWEGPVPKNCEFEPMEMAPDPSQGDIQDRLMEMKAITIGNEDFQIFKS